MENSNRCWPRAPHGVRFLEAGRVVDRGLGWKLEELQRQIWQLHREMSDMKEVVERNKEREEVEMGWKRLGQD